MGLNRSGKTGSRNTIIISLRGPAHNHRLYAHNNTFAAYPRSPNYYRDGNDRNSLEPRAKLCNLPQLRMDCIMHYVYVHVTRLFFRRLREERERKKDR